MLENSAPFSFADLVERVSPAVVTITSETTTTDSDMDSDNIPAPFRDLFNQFNNGQKPQPHRALSAGSGFIIDKAGFVVTNNHVVDASKKITVKLPDGRSFTAKLIGTDAATDIALLKINSDKPLPHGRIRRRQEAARRRLGGGGGQSLRSFQFGDRGYRLLAGPQHRIQPAIHQLHPDRRAHQSRQFGRSRPSTCAARWWA